jgi:hypothetical protein
VGNSLRLDRQPGGENLATGLSADARGSVNGQRWVARGKSGVYDAGWGHGHVTPKRVLHSNFGRRIGTIRKSATYEISFATERRSSALC